MTHTPGPWTSHGAGGEIHGDSRVVATMTWCSGMDAEDEANALLVEAAPDMLAALRLHKAWRDSEHTGPDYGGQSRDTHPDGEKIWRLWWDNQLDLCRRAEDATDAAIAKAEGKPATVADAIEDIRADLREIMTS